MRKQLCALGKIRTTWVRRLISSFKRSEHVGALGNAACDAGVGVDRSSAFLLAVFFQPSGEPVR